MNTSQLEETIPDQYNLHGIYSYREEVEEIEK